MNKYFTVLIAALVISAAAFGCGKKTAQETAPMLVTVEPTTNLITKTGAPVQTGSAVAPEEAAVDESEGYVPPAIDEIQQALSNAGLYTGSVDGKIGPMTKKAITEFQKQNGLVADGKVGRKTWEKLKAYLNQEQTQ